MAESKEATGKASPYTREQIQKLNKICADIAHVEKMLEAAADNLQRETAAKQKLDEKSSECREVFAGLSRKALVQMVSQTKEIEKFMINHREQLDLYNRLKFMSEEEISQAEFALQKVGQETKKFIENVESSQKEDLEDLIKKIKKLAKQLGDEAEEQMGRLDQFEDRQLNSELADQIPEQDLLFLKKEVIRYKGSIVSLVAAKE